MDSELQEEAAGWQAVSALDSRSRGGPQQRYNRCSVLPVRSLVFGSGGRYGCEAFDEQCYVGVPVSRVFSVSLV